MSGISGWFNAMFPFTGHAKLVLHVWYLQLKAPKKLSLLWRACILLEALNFIFQFKRCMYIYQNMKNYFTLWLFVILIYRLVMTTPNLLKDQRFKSYQKCQSGYLSIYKTMTKVCQCCVQMSQFKKIPLESKHHTRSTYLYVGSGRR